MTTFESKLFIGFGTIIALVLFIIAFSFYSGNKQISTSYWVNHTNEVLDKSSHTLLLSADIESKALNYVILKNQNDADQFEITKKDIFEHLDQMKMLTADNELQQERLKLLTNMVYDQVSFYAQSISIMKAHGFDEAIIFLGDSTGVALTKAIRRKNAEIQHEERTLLVKRQKESDNAISTFNIAFFAFLLVVSTLIVTIYFVIRKNIQFQRRSEIQSENHQKELQKLLLDLESKIAELENAKTELNEALLTEKNSSKEIDRLNHSLEEKVKQRTKELEESSHELESFSYSVSHDLRTPLRAVNGYAKIIEEDYSASIDENAKSMLKSIRNSASTMGILIDGLLAFSRLGRKDISKTTVNMTEVAEEVVWEMNNSYRHEIQITINDLHTCSADRDLMKQVFINLLSNSIKFTARKKNPVVEVGSKETDKDFVYFVKDNGAGFNMAYQEKLFNVFQRLHSAKEFDGTGIGLALVKRIIVKHHGNVSAEGKEGEGAEFRFSIPKK